MTHPKVSIIVVNFNQRQLTLDCLKSLSKITYPKYEIILVDNASQDGSVQAIEKKFSKIILVKLATNTGFVGGNNAGIKEARGKYILFLNNDTKVKHGFLEPLVENLIKDEKLGIVQSKIFVMDDPDRLDSVISYQTSTGFLYHKGYLDKDREEYKNFQYTFSAKGACMLIKREVLRLGGFDQEYFAYFEETDLCWRAWAMGYKVGFEPKSIIYHKMGATSSKMKSTFIHYHSFKNRVRTIIKNASVATLLWMLPIHLSACLLLSLYFLISGQSSGSLAILRAILWNIGNLQSTLNLRIKVQKGRKWSDSKIFSQVLKNPSLSFYFHHLSLVQENLSK